MQLRAADALAFIGNCVRIHGSRFRWCEEHQDLHEGERYSASSVRKSLEFFPHPNISLLFFSMSWKLTRMHMTGPNTDGLARHMPSNDPSISKAEPRSLFCVVPSTISSITAAAVNSSVIQVSAWTQQSSGACTILYDACICLASSTCSQAGLAAGTSNPYECKNNISAGVHCFLLSLFINTNTFSQIPFLPAEIMILFLHLLQSPHSSSLLSHPSPPTNFSFEQKPSRTSRPLRIPMKLQPPLTLQPSREPPKMTVSFLPLSSLILIFILSPLTTFPVFQTHQNLASSWLSSLSFFSSDMFLHYCIAF